MMMMIQCVMSPVPPWMVVDDRRMRHVTAVPVRDQQLRLRNRNRHYEYFVGSRYLHGLEWAGSECSCGCYGMVDGNGGESVATFGVSVMAPGFQGYADITCDFRNGKGFAFISNGFNSMGGATAAQGYLVSEEIVTSRLVGLVTTGLRVCPHRAQAARPALHFTSPSIASSDRPPGLSSCAYRAVSLCAKGRTLLSPPERQDETTTGEPSSRRGSLFFLFKR